jgi:hypothetical protein
MVYEKNRSGDPDYDDKQPPEHHLGGQVVSAGDGVFISVPGGPVDASGAHVNLDTSPEDLDNRPAPGGTADETSSVQVPHYRTAENPDGEARATQPVAPKSSKGTSAK